MSAFAERAPTPSREFIDGGATDIWLAARGRSPSRTNDGWSTVPGMRTAALIALLVIVGCHPRGETPGFRLGGADAEPPSSFAFVADHEIIQLAARGALLPRVVNIWGTGVDDALYVWADPGTGWSNRVEKRPNDVRVRIGDKAYRVSAVRVTDLSELSRVAQAYEAKYGEDILDTRGRFWICSVS